MSKKLRYGSRKKKALVAAAIGLAVIILGVSVWNFAQDRQDANRFAQAERNKNTAFLKLINGFKGVIRTETLQHCYNSEQGPWDNGRLWCAVSSAAYLDNAMPDTTIEDKLSGIIKTEGWTITDKRRANVEFEGAKDLVCELLVQDGNLATEPTRDFPAEPHSKQTIIIECADRAKAKHYPYIN